MKKFFAIFVLTILIFTMAACKSNENTPDTATFPREIPITEEAILKYYDYFSLKAPGFLHMFDISCSFADAAFDTPAAIPNEGLLLYAFESTAQKDLHWTNPEGSVVWRTSDIDNEVEKAFGMAITDYEASGLVTEDEEKGTLTATGWSFHSILLPKLVKLIENTEGIFTAEFDFYSVFDYYTEVSDFDARAEILKEHSEILNSQYCAKISKTIVFQELTDDEGLYLRFISMK